MNRRLRGLYGVALVVNRASRTRKVVDLIDLNVERESDVVSDHLKTRVVQQMFYVALSRRIVIVHAENIVATIQQALAEVRTNET